MDVVASHHDTKAELVVVANDADIIVDRIDAQFCRPVIGVNCKTTAITANGERCIVRSWKIRLDSEVPVAAVAIAEVRRSLAADEMVPGRTGGVDDIGSEQIRTPQCDEAVLTIGSIICGKQVSVEIIADRLHASL